MLLAMDTPVRRPSHMRGIAILVLLASFAYFLPNVLNRITDAMFFPWAHASPSLLDQWVGQLTTGNGAALVVGMSLERDYTDRERVCVRCNQLKGSAATCDARGTVLQYRVSGSPRDRQGRQLHIGASPTPQPPPDALELSTLAGTWDYGDLLELEADFHWRRGGAAISSTDDPATSPVPIRMERKPAAVFRAMCDSLRARS